MLRRKTKRERDLVPVTFGEVLEAFKRLGPEDAARVQHLNLSATNDVTPHDVLWVTEAHAELLGLEKKP